MFLKRISCFCHIQVWALASVLGPPVGGALASSGQWRWLFCEISFPFVPAVGGTLTRVFPRPEPSALWLCRHTRIFLPKNAHSSWTLASESQADRLDVRIP